MTISLRLVARWVVHAVAMACVYSCPASASAPAVQSQSSASPPQPATQHGTIVLPTVSRGPFFFVEAHVNGRGPFLMLLDSGSSNVAVARDRALQMADETHEVSAELTDSHDKTTKLSKAIEIKSLKLGGFDAGQCEAAVVDFRLIRKGLSDRLDGVIGINIFESGLLRMDYPAHRISIEPGTLPMPDGRVILELGFDGSGLPVVHADLMGKTRQFVIDTGSHTAWSIVDFDASRLIGKPSGIASMSVSGIRSSRQGRLDGDIHLGKFKFEKPIVASSFSTDNWIGSAAFSRMVVTFDIAHKRVKLESAGAESILTSAERQLPVTVKRVGKCLWVRSVAPLSEAASRGLASGDRILAINGVPVCDGALLQELAEEATLTVQRPAGLIEIKVPTVTPVP